MRGDSVTGQWRTLQMFLSEDGVHEVEADVDDYAQMRCDCSDFKRSKKCKHTRLVKRRIDINGGTYAIKISDSVPDEAVDQAMLSPEAFRQFLITHAKVEFLK
jgi:hypothetical protein